VGSVHAGVELQQQREGQARVFLLGVDEAGLVAEHRPVVDQLVHAERRTLHTY
jgi:hypothetical protein